MIEINKENESCLEEHYKILEQLYYQDRVKDCIEYVENLGIFIFEILF